MVPLVEVVALAEDASPDEAIALIQERGFSRLPVYRDRIDHVVGVVTAMDLLRDGAQADHVGALARPPYIVPETKRVDDLLREMQKSRIQLAVVVDEYGGSVGIVTVEDIVEEIVGDIDDEHDDPVPEPDDGEWVLPGAAGRDEVHHRVGFVLPPGSFHTLAGYLLTEFGRVPGPGERLRRDGYVFEVLGVDRRRIAEVRVAKVASDS
jgi:CBS domain containing-hemolysin-like protein